MDVTAKLDDATRKRIDAIEVTSSTKWKDFRQKVLDIITEENDNEKE